MSTIAGTAEAFLKACDWGGGWDGCSQYVSSEAAPFSGQAKSFAPYKTIKDYAEWVKALAGVRVALRSDPFGVFRSDAPTPRSP